MKLSVLKYRFLFVWIFFVAIQAKVFSEPDNKTQKPTKTVLLTGAAGFIGSNCLEYLYDTHENYDFIVLDALTYAGFLENIPPRILNSHRVRFVKGSVIDDSLVDELMKESNYVIHFAAETHVTRSIADDLIFFETDVLGTRVLMVALVKYSKTIERFIHISTSEVYGTALTIPMNEDHPLESRSPYAAAKVGADRLVHAYNCTYDVPVVIVRPFNNYGPKQHIEKLIPRFITSALNGKPLTIHGTGEQKRDWIYVKDVSKALDAMLNIPDFSIIKGQAINLGTEKSVSVFEVAQLILKYFNLHETQIKFVSNRPGQVDNHVGSFKKAKALLNWEPTTSFEEGLKETIKWYIDHPSYWKKLEGNSVVPIKTSANQIELQ
ncbi:MAG: dTDP-glucose 4,6-dehydratase [Chlamydiae bacterium]|nr:dTDP-glucose 4,6-dehydratase [Chlamydiota bacterium]